MRIINSLLTLPGAAVALALTMGGAVHPTAVSAQQQCVPGQFGECHFDKIIFRPTDGLKWDCVGDFVDPPSSTGARVRLFDTDWLDIKVPDDPRRVADIKEKVVRFLAERCQRANGAPILKPHITIIDVEYAIVPAGGPAPLGPDLTVRLLGNGATVSCSGPVGGVVCTTTVRYEIANIGDVDVATPFRAKISADQGISQERAYGGLAAGATMVDSVTLNPVTPPGNCFDSDCTETVTVDSNDDVAESDETNNTATRTTPG